MNDWQLKVYKINLIHGCDWLIVECGNAKNFNWENLSSFREERADNGMVIQVVFTDETRFSLGLL